MIALLNLDLLLQAHKGKGEFADRARRLVPVDMICILECADSRFRGNDRVECGNDGQESAAAAR